MSLLMSRVPSSYAWVGVQWTHSFQNKGSKWDHKESIHFSHLLSGEPDYFGRNKISSGGDLSHYSSASLY